MSYVIYNNLTKGTPTQWEIFPDGDQAMKKLLTLSDDWDSTDLETFKEWYPELIE